MKLLKLIFSAIIFTTIISCSKSGPQEIAVGKDQCENCKMTITEPKYATQLITEKGRVYKFDDIKCMQDYATSHQEASTAKTYVANFPTGEFFDSSNAIFITGGSIKSPMNGNTQAYKDKAAAEKAAAELGATLTTK